MVKMFIKFKALTKWIMTEKKFIKFAPLDVIFFWNILFLFLKERSRDGEEGSILLNKGFKYDRWDSSEGGRKLTTKINYLNGVGQNGQISFRKTGKEDCGYMVCGSKFFFVPSEKYWTQYTTYTLNYFSTPTHSGEKCTQS